MLGKNLLRLVLDDLDTDATSDEYADRRKLFDCLDNAAAAIRALGRAESDFPRRSNRDRDEMALRTALLRAWFHYDRAEWREGLDWAAAPERSPLRVGHADADLSLIAAIIDDPSVPALGDADCDASGAVDGWDLVCVVASMVAQ